MMDDVMRMDGISSSEKSKSIIKYIMGVDKRKYVSI
jgi:hypothetical protein